MQNRKNKNERMGEVLSLIENQPRTRKEIADELNLTPRALDRYLFALRLAKLVYIKDWPLRHSKRTPLYAKGDEKDAPKPDDMNYNMKDWDGVVRPIVPASDIKPFRDPFTSAFFGSV